jgi:hypothetical protein
MTVQAEFGGSANGSPPPSSRKEEVLSGICKKLIALHFARSRLALRLAGMTELRSEQRPARPLAGSAVFV